MPGSHEKSTPTSHDSAILFQVARELGEIKAKIDQLLLQTSRTCGPTSLPKPTDTTSMVSMAERLSRLSSLALSIGRMVIWVAPKLVVAWMLAQGYLGAVWRLLRSWVGM